MLLQGYPPLFGIQLAFHLAGAELHVQVGNLLIQDAAFELRLDAVIPDVLRIHMQVLLEAPGHDYPARKLGPKFGRYG